MYTQDTREMKGLQTSTKEMPIKGKKGKKGKKKNGVNILVPPPMIVMEFKKKGNK